MTHALPPCVVPAAAKAATAALLVLGLVLRAGAGGALEHQIVNLNFETVRVTWDENRTLGRNLTFLYRFEAKNLSECSHYILRRGGRAGCLLAAEGDTMLSFSVWNGTLRLLSRSFWISSYLKPSSPGALRVLWRPGAVTVACPDLPLRGLKYEVQHKSRFDPEWHSQTAETCNVTLQGLDVDKCYSFRARVTPKNTYYDSTTYPSDWSDVTHLQRGQPRDSCQEERAFSKFVLIYVLAALLTFLLLILCTWKLRRAKRLLMPSVPDPKSGFPGLFEAHGGNFQEWIRDTQRLTPLQKAEDGVGDPEGLLIGPLELQPPETHAATPGARTEETGRPCPPPPAPGGAPVPHPRGNAALALALSGVQSVGDTCYVTL